MIHSVRGWIEQENIGFCHSHEHLFLSDGVPATCNPALRIDDFKLTVKELEEYKAIGGHTIIDAQPLGAGRMEKHLVSASENTGVQIVAATGFHKLAFYSDDHWIFTYNSEQLSEVFIHELEKGMYINTETEHPNDFISNRAGFIKVAIDEQRLYDPDKKWFKAAVEASLSTGAPIMCHTESKKQALFITDYFLQEGMQPENIILCHLDRELDQFDVHIELAKRGVFLEYDTIGRFKYHNDAEEADMIVYMLDHGLEKNILLSLDTTRERLKSYGGNIGLDHLKVNFLPLLLERNIDNQTIMDIMTVNPARAFSNIKVRGVNK